MKYIEGRDLIQDGDIVFVCRPHHKFSFFANTISFFTRSEIYHCGIAVWMKSDSGEKRLFLVEADLNNRRMIPLSYYEKQSMFVLAKPEEVKFEYFSGQMLERIGSEKYNLLKAVEAGVRKYLLLPRLSLNGEICSEMCLRMWRIGGFTKMNQQLLTPDQLYSELYVEYGISRRVVINES